MTCPHCNLHVALVAAKTRRCTNIGCGKNLDAPKNAPVQMKPPKQTYFRFQVSSMVH